MSGHVTKRLHLVHMISSYAQLEGMARAKKQANEETLRKKRAEFEKELLAYILDLERRVPPKAEQKVVVIADDDFSFEEAGVAVAPQHKNGRSKLYNGATPIYARSIGGDASVIAVSNMPISAKQANEAYRIYDNGE